MSQSGKNRPHWRARLASGREKGCKAKFLCTPSRFGDGNPNRRRCKVKARSTGLRCKNDCIGGAPACRVHGGHWLGYRAARKELGADRVVSITTGKSVTRKGLARLSTIERYPVGVPYEASPVERGKRIEEAHNRAWLRGDPG